MASELNVDNLSLSTGLITPQYQTDPVEEVSSEGNIAVVGGRLKYYSPSAGWSFAGKRPQIVTSNLSMHLDPGNPLSFKGKPANNILANNARRTYNSLSSGNTTYGPISLITTETPYGNQAYQCTFTAAGDNGYYSTNNVRFTSNSVSIPRDGVTHYKYSVWVYVLDERWTDWNNSVYKYVTGSNGAPGFSDSGQRKYDAIGREWRRYWRTSWVKSGGGNMSEYHTFFKNGTLSSNLTVLLAAPDFYAESLGGAEDFPEYAYGNRSASSDSFADLSPKNLAINPISESQCPRYTSSWGGALEFNGSTSYFQTSTPSISFSPNNFTFEIWFRPNDQYARFMTPSANGIDNWIGYDNSNQRLEVRFTEVADVNNRSAYSQVNSVPHQTWTHAVVIINNLNIKIYINGEKQHDSNQTISIGNWGGTWRYGQRGNGTSWYNGYMGQIRIYDGELTQEQVLQNYNATKYQYQ